MTIRRPLMVLGCTSTAGKSLLVTALRPMVLTTGRRRRALQGPEHVEQRQGRRRWRDRRRAVATGPAAGSSRRGDEPGAAQAGGGHPQPGGRRRCRARHDLTELPWRERAPHLWPAMAAAFDGVAGEPRTGAARRRGQPGRDQPRRSGQQPDARRTPMPPRCSSPTSIAAERSRTSSARGRSCRTRPASGSAASSSTSSEATQRCSSRGRRRSRSAPAWRWPACCRCCAHELPDEEGARDPRRPAGRGASVAVVRYPYASNLDELHGSSRVAARLRLATRPRRHRRRRPRHPPRLEARCRRRRVAARPAPRRSIRAHATARAGASSGSAAGAMLLGTDVRDPYGVEGAATGLGLLPLRTKMSPDKLTRRGHHGVPRLDAPWSALSGLRATATRSATASYTAPVAKLPRWWGAAPCWPRPSTGCSKRPRSSTQCAVSTARPLEDTFDLLADAVDEHLDTDLLTALTRRS